MKKIPYILLALVMMMPLGASAASFTFLPALGSYNTGETFTTSVFVTPAAGESISATKISLTFPADKLEIVSYTPVNGGNILAHIGIKTDNAAGTIVDNVAFNPAITASTKVATIIFKAKAEGNAQLAVSPDSKLLDTANTDKKTTSAMATYTVSVPAPAPVTTPAPVVPETTVDTVVTPTSTPESTPQASSGQDAEGGAESDEVVEDAETGDEVVVDAPADDTTGQVAAAAAGTGALGTIKSNWYYILLLLLPFFGWLIWKRRKKDIN